MDLATMTRACAATEDVVAAVGADQHDLPTPCTEWTVRDLLNHLVGTLVLARAGGPGPPRPPPRRRPGRRPARRLPHRRGRAPGGRRGRRAVPAPRHPPG